MTWDLFCSVIDNFGDIGITWRLARQLAVERGIHVRLWVDDLHAFARIHPALDPSRDVQTLGVGTVEVHRWRSPLPDFTPGDVVIEALACTLPETFVARMAACTPPPFWINLEYLTAEDWAEGVHGLPSPHPRLPLNKYFFMPGFSTHTGGLIRESGLMAERDAFQCNTQAQQAFWQSLGLPARSRDEWRISLFSYENRALPSLMQAWAQGSTPIRALVPEGRAVPEIAAWFGVPAPRPGETLTRGQLRLHILPMLDQAAYDRLLWACDLNFVRGEDSFVRAQFAARPLVWQAYRQEDGAHFTKLDAFLKRYTTTLNSDSAALACDFWQAWNHETPLDARWPSWLATLPAQRKDATAWSEHLHTQPDLTANLLIFLRKKQHKS